MVWDYLFSVWGMLIVGIVAFTLYGVVEVIARNWRKACEAEIEGALKAEMIKQGRSADEIERILQASGKGRQPVQAD